MIKLKWEVVEDAYDDGEWSADVGPCYLSIHNIDTDYYVTLRGPIESTFFGEPKTLDSAKRAARKLLKSACSDCRALLEAVEGEDEG